MCNCRYVSCLSFSLPSLSFLPLPLPSDRSCGRRSLVDLSDGDSDSCTSFPSTKEEGLSRISELTECFPFDALFGLRWKWRRGNGRQRKRRIFKLTILFTSLYTLEQSTIKLFRLSLIRVFSILFKVKVSTGTWLNYNSNLIARCDPFLVLHLFV